MIEQIKAMHAQGIYKAVIATTGGGAGAFGKLLRYGGGSATLLEGVIPYDTHALRNYIGGQPDQFCSEATARAMAVASFERARKLSPNTYAHNLIGIGTTAKLAKDGERQGREHAIYVAAHSALRTATYEVKLQESRLEEEAAADDLTLYALLHFGQLMDRGGWQAYGRWPMPVQKEVKARDHLSNVLYGSTKSIPVTVYNYGSGHRNVLFPGSFNPMHKNHVQVMTLAAKHTGSPVSIELAIRNVAKPTLDYIEIENRIKGIEERLGDAKSITRSIILSNTPTFIEKVQEFPHTTFVIGGDTLKRLADPVYYDNSVPKMLDAFDFFKLRDARFLVFNRLGYNVQAEHKQLLDLCEFVTEYEDDGWSSTKERNSK